MNKKPYTAPELKLFEREPGPKASHRRYVMTKDTLPSPVSVPEGDAREIARRLVLYPLTWTIETQTEAITAALLSAESRGERKGIEKAAKWHEQRAELHARDAKWMGPNREYLTGARIAGAEMSPMNGPAVSYDHEMAAAKAIRSLSSPEEG